MIAETSQKVPATLADVLEEVENMFLTVAHLKIPFQCGREFLDNFHVGSAPRVLFVPESPGGRLGAAAITGRPASWMHACEVHVLAKPGPSALRRYDHVYALANKVIAAIGIATTGRVAWGQVGEATPMKKDAGGVGVRFQFFFTRDIENWSDLWAHHGPISDDTRQEARPLSLIGYTPSPTYPDPNNTVSPEGITFEPTLEPKD